jgi:hypothetical protein
MVWPYQPGKIKANNSYYEAVRKVLSGSLHSGRGLPPPLILYRSLKLTIIKRGNFKLLLETYHYGYAHS